MKRLYLIRHAEAGAHNSDDHARQLTKNGIEMCQFIGQQMQNSSPVPDYSICSSSSRTGQTAALAIESGSLDINLDSHTKLYLASADDIINIIQSVTDDCQSLMLVGHNPGLHRCAINLASHSKPADKKQLSKNFPPASIASFDIKIDSWGLIRPEDCQLVGFS